MIRPIAFCAGLALAWCGTAEAQTLGSEGQALCQNDTEAPHWVPWNEAVERTPRNGAVDFYKCNLSRPEDAVRSEIDDLRERVTQLKGLVKALLRYLPECRGEPPEHMPCIEKREAE